MRLMAEKYQRGAEEHGTFLPDLPVLQLIDEAIGENLDQFAYLQTLRDNYVKETQLQTRKDINDETRLLRGL